jgi:hypothetical protein
MASRRKNPLGELREYLISNQQRFVEGTELTAFIGKNWRKWIRVLSEYEGYAIVVMPEISQPGPHIVLLKSDRPRHWISTNIEDRDRDIISARTDLCCKMCGRMSGDSDPIVEGRRLRLFVSQMFPAKDWIGATSENIEVICILCREGIAKIRNKKPTALKLLTQLRRASSKEQLQVMEWLIGKYPMMAKKEIDLKVSQSVSASSRS